MKHSVAGIVCIDSLYLVARRVPVGAMGGRWEFPGGKVEAGESYEKALVREFDEEFSIPIAVGAPLAEAAFRHNGGEVRLHAYEVFFPEDDISWVLTEHTEVRWVRLDEIESLNFVDSDLLLLPKIRAQKGLR